MWMVSYAPGSRVRCIGAIMIGACNDVIVLRVDPGCPEWLRLLCPRYMCPYVSNCFRSDTVLSGHACSRLGRFVQLHLVDHNSVCWCQFAADSTSLFDSLDLDTFTFTMTRALRAANSKGLNTWRSALKGLTHGDLSDCDAGSLRSSALAVSQGFALGISKTDAKLPGRYWDPSCEWTPLRRGTQLVRICWWTNLKQRTRVYFKPTDSMKCRVLRQKRLLREFDPSAIREEGMKREIEKFIIKQPPKGEKDDYDSENSWISDGLPSSSRRRRRWHGRWKVWEWREKWSAFFNLRVFIKE